MTKIRELRIQRGIQQKEMAAILGIPANTYNQWENGKRQPDNQSLLKIAEHLNVTVDYLLGDYVDSEGISIARKRVKLLLNETDFSMDDIETAFGTSIATLKAWCDGYGDFFNNKLDTLANFFGVSVDYLLGREEIKDTTSDYSDVKVALFGGDGEVTDAMWDEVKKFADYVKAKYLKEKK